MYTLQEILYLQQWTKRSTFSDGDIGSLVSLQPTTELLDQHVDRLRCWQDVQEPDKRREDGDHCTERQMLEQERFICP
jgi:hypothetical protein